MPGLVWGLHCHLSHLVTGVIKSAKSPPVPELPRRPLLWYRRGTQRDGPGRHSPGAWLAVVPGLAGPAPGSAHSNDTAAATTAARAVRCCAGGHSVGAVRCGGAAGQDHGHHRVRCMMIMTHSAKARCRQDYQKIPTTIVKCDQNGMPASPLHDAGEPAAHSGQPAFTLRDARAAHP
jgi:hypothetical protein